MAVCGAWLSMLVAVAAAAEPSPTATPLAMLAPQLSTASAATEYWDVTAWLDSGDRVVARFLVTNQGPGSHTAAAVGHVVLASGRTLPFKWGRLRDAWTLAPDGRKLKIAKATLDLSGAAIVCMVRSPKHGVEFRLEIERPSTLVGIRGLAPGYPIDVAMPGPARGNIAGRAVGGVAAVTHTWVEATEAEIIRRRIELFAFGPDLTAYVVDLMRADGTRKSAAYVARAGATVVALEDVALDFGTTSTSGGDPRYPLPTAWHAKTAGLALDIAVGPELLRMNPLDLLPQPFRLLLSLGARPQRVWADASVALQLPASGDAAPPPTTLRGLAVATFARPER